MVSSTWPNLKPFALTSQSQFRPEPPIALPGEQWAADYNEIKDLGSKTSTKRSARQTEDARFWLITGPQSADPIVRQLQSVPGVGPIVGLTYRATLDTVGRFPAAGHVSSCLGLVPREDSSGERRQRGPITKTGSSEARSMLIQAAWTGWRSRTVRTTHLRTWADALAARRGKRIAVVALARRLSRILFAIWRDGTTFAAPPVAA